MAESGDELLTAAVGGDADALKQLLRICGPQLRERLAGKIAKSWQSALEIDDVLQVTYLEAFLRICQFKPSGPGALLAWLTRIAENNLRDAIKELDRQKRPPPRQRIQAGGDESFMALVEILGVTTTTPSRHAGRNEAFDYLAGALKRLPRDYETVVRLYDLEGRPAAEVAAAVSRSPGAMYMLRARAHDRLREELGSASQFFSSAG